MTHEARQRSRQAGGSLTDGDPVVVGPEGGCGGQGVCKGRVGRGLKAMLKP